MRLSLFRKSSSQGPSSTPSSPATENGPPSPAVPSPASDSPTAMAAGKKSHRFSQMLPMRFKSTSDMNSTDKLVQSPAPVVEAESEERPLTALPSKEPQQDKSPASQNNSNLLSSASRSPAPYGDDSSHPTLRMPRYERSSSARSSEPRYGRYSARTADALSPARVESSRETLARLRSHERIQPKVQRSGSIEHYQASSSRLRPLDRWQTTFQERDQSSHGNGATSNGSRRLSSPSDGAAKRNRLRASYSGRVAANQASNSNDAFSRKPRIEPTRVSTQHLIPSSLSPMGLDGASDEEPPFKRPSYLHNRQSVQRLSGQSMPNHQIDPLADDSEALGTATPATGTQSKTLSRLPSVGSLASSTSGRMEVSTPRQTLAAPADLDTMTNLERVAEVDDHFSSTHTTPRARRLRSPLPTDTAIAQHVRNVEVPETVARQFRAARPPPADSMFSSSSPSHAVGANTVSLKEQNSKVEKLTKENFDLKLKIHFLYQALDNRSEEGVKDMIAKIAQLQSELVQVKKENQSLKRQLKLAERRDATSRAGASSIAPSRLESDDGVTSADLARAQALAEEEVDRLHRRMQDLEAENNALARNGSQHLSERLRDEQAAREDAEQTAHVLQQELDRLRAERGRSSRLRLSPSDADLDKRSISVASGATGEGSLSGTTLVGQLRKENETLRRDLGAQASMLTSRNRERDRLQQEIEDLKLVQRRGEGMSPGSAAGDSILDRSISRAHGHRSSSRLGESIMDEQERDRFETTRASLRDENSMLKMQLQDLRSELANLGDDDEHVLSLKAERDEALEALREADSDVQFLADDVRALEADLQQKDHDMDALEDALRRRESEVRAFKSELQAINDAFNGLVEDSETQQTTIQSLQLDISAANGELEAMEARLRDILAAKERLEVQQESSENEIAFLREEQEGDKIKIGDLQSALRMAKSSLRGHDDGHLRNQEELERHVAQSRDEARRLQRQVAQREADVKELQERLNDATSTLEEAVSSFDSTKSSHADELAKLNDDIDRLTRQLSAEKGAHSRAKSLLQERDTLIESSGHDLRKYGEMLDKERQGRQHDRNEVERIMARAKGKPEAHIYDLEMALKTTKAKLDEVARLECELHEKVEKRDVLLHSHWNHLVAFSNTEGIIDEQEPLPSTSDVDAGLITLTKRLPATVNAMASYLSLIRSKIIAAEQEASNDFEALSDALSERTSRLEALEGIVAQSEADKERMYSDQAAAHQQEKYTRVKEENRTLRREIRHMKQGSFSLPGLPSPHESRTQRSPSAFDQDDTAVPPPVFQGPRSKEKSRKLSSSRPGTEDVNSAALFRQLESSRSRSFADLHESHDGADDEREVNGTRVSSKPVLPQRSNSSMATMTVSASDRSWYLRLDEMVKRLRHERENRLIDREAARERLAAGERERDELKRQLQLASEHNQRAEQPDKGQRRARHAQHEPQTLEDTQAVPADGSLGAANEKE